MRSQSHGPPEKAPSRGGRSPDAPGALGPAGLPPSAYWEHRLGEDFSLGGTGYLGLGRTFNEWAYRVRLAALRRSLRDHRIEVKGNSVLEVGFGTGYFVDFWIAQGAGSLLGLDITHRAVETLSERHPGHRFLQQDIADPACPRYGTFGIVTAFDVLFHLLDDAAFDRAIGNLCRHLRPGGYVLLTDVFSASLPLRGSTQYSRPLPVYSDRLLEHGVRIEGLHPVFFTMSSPADAGQGWRGAAARAYWNGVSHVLGRVPGAGHVLGPACYLIDWTLQRTCKIGPSVKLLVGRANP